MTKSITLRLPEDEYESFNAICNERGYSKTGKIREFIRNMVRAELESVKLSRGEWRAVTAGIKEIADGDYVSFEELKREFAQKSLESKKGSKKRKEIS